MFPPADDSPDNVLTSPVGTKTVLNFVNDSIFQQHLVSVSQRTTLSYQISHIHIVLLRVAHSPLCHLWYVVTFSHSVWSNPPLVTRWKHVYQNTQRRTDDKPMNQWGSETVFSDIYSNVALPHKQGWKWSNVCHHSPFIEFFFCAPSSEKHTEIQRCLSPWEFLH